MGDVCGNPAITSWYGKYPSIYRFCLSSQRVLSSINSFITSNQHLEILKYRLKFNFENQENSLSSSILADSCNPYEQHATNW